MLEAKEVATVAATTTTQAENDKGCMLYAVTLVALFALIVILTPQKELVNTSGEAMGIAIIRLDISTPLAIAMLVASLIIGSSAAAVLLGGLSGLLIGVVLAPWGVSSPLWTMTVGGAAVFLLLHALEGWLAARVRRHLAT